MTTSFDLTDNIIKPEDRVFESELKTAKPIVTTTRLALGASAFLAIMGTFLPHFKKDLDPNFKIWSMLAGIVGAGSLTAVAYSSGQTERLHKALLQMQLDSIKKIIAQYSNNEQILKSVEFKQHLAQRVQALPLELRQRLTQEYDLMGYVSFPELVEMNALEAEFKEEKQTVELPLNIGNQKDIIQISEDLSYKPDYMWLDKDFVLGCKAVIGASGSGKSTYLNFEALSFIQSNPEGEIRIGDLHFDDEQPNWLPGVPVELLTKKYVANKTQDIYNIFIGLKATLEQRIANNDRRNPKPLKFICDEFVGFIERCEKAQKEDVLKVIQMVAFEGRKYGIYITLGLHSIKKEVTGLNSEMLANMHMLLLGSGVLADSSSKFPSDFDIKHLIGEQKGLQNMLGKKAFAVVIRKKSQSPEVVALPFIDLSEFKLKLEVNPIQQIKDWILGLGYIPNYATLREGWKTITGEELNENQMQDLIKALGLEENYV